jgi:excisionase family DNA binding protein
MCTMCMNEVQMKLSAAILEKRTKVTYTPEELHASGILPIGRTGIYRGLNDGTIPSLKVGKKFIIPLAALDQWMKSAGVHDVSA